MKNAQRYYPLTYPQRSVWVMDSICPDTSIAAISATLKCDSDLDCDRIQQAVDALIRNNENFRIRFTRKDGEPVQYIVPHESAQVEFFDFRNQPIEALYEWDSQLSQIPFEKLDAPLYYFALAKYNTHSTALYVKMHHLIADGWSMVNLGSKVIRYYEQLMDGCLPDDGSPSYLDFAQREADYLHSEKYAKDEAYWKEKYKDGLELTVLKPHKSSTGGFRAERKTFIVPQKLSQKIRTHCQENKTSIFTLFLSALCLYINRVTGQGKVTVGMPVANRINSREKRTLGMFTSTVPFTVYVNNDVDFSTFCKDIYSEWITVLKHQKCPYESIVKCVREKHKGVEKLYDISISYQNAKFYKSQRLENQEGRWHFNHYQLDSLAIHINDREDDGNLILDYDYLVDVFSAKEIAFLHDHVVRLLWHSLDNPARKLSYIHMMSECERTNILDGFNDADAGFPQDATVHRLFERQVHKTPDAVALVYEDVELTYHQLNAQANRLARLLRAQGVGTDVIVGVLLNRSHKMIISILAILKAGGCYMPVDPDYPSDRIRYTIADSGTVLMVAERATAHILQDEDVAVLNIDDADLQHQRGENMEAGGSPSDLCYVIYTSGSTGTPKGVMVEHRNVVPLIVNDTYPFDLTHEDVWTVFHSFCFDYSVWETYGALLRGAKLVVVPKHVMQSPHAFWQLLQAHKVTVLNQIPVSLYNVINEEMSVTKKTLALRYVFFGGEPVKAVLLKPMMEKYPEVKFVNLYGITETTVADTYKIMTLEDTNSSLNIIGRPLPTVNAYILDKYLMPVPIGVMGELCIGGEGVARGYLNRPALTEERFVPNPFRPGERMYKSGDYARWFPMGEIEYLGRIDNQVKIRGFRIELGEVEHKILAYEGVAKALVLAKENVVGKKYLCAYVIPEKDISFTGLRDYLLQELPHYMVPSYFVAMEHFPLTASGKIDTKILPEPEVVSEEAYVAPRNETEEVLCAVWGKVLQVERVGIDDNFFDLGGDSLTTIQMLTELNSHRLDVRIQDVYEYPTIRALGAAVVQAVPAREAACEGSTPMFAMGSNVKVEQAPIDQRILSGELPRLDAVALSYIPDDLVHGVSDTRQKLLLDGMGGKPVLYHRISCGMGQIGLIILPMLGSQIYAEKEKLLDLCLQAIRLGHNLGANVVSLTGLIPSATDYGCEIEQVCLQNGLSIGITTGHTTTASSVVLSIERLLEESGRYMRDEQMSVIGLGSVGSTVLQLMLSVLEHPQSITLCDIPQKEGHLKRLRAEIKAKYAYQGNIHISLAAGNRVEQRVYDSSLIVGATNVPNVLEVAKIRAGTLIVDDSGPHCFRKNEAIDRLLNAQDILFTEGGVLEAPNRLEKMTYLPTALDFTDLERYRQHFLAGSEITGCILSSLLSAKYIDLEPKVGIAPIDACRRHYRRLSALGFRGARLHCDDYVLPQLFIEEFKNTHGGKAMRNEDGA